MRDLLYFIIGILLGLICLFFDGSAVMAQKREQVMMTRATANMPRRKPDRRARAPRRKHNSSCRIGCYWVAFVAASRNNCSRPSVASAGGAVTPWRG